ncbi:hypothetical protein B0O80DRAFT_103585 [Mortierella sp. GBAus27b]|nr:hypothetical protein B0O80DRAFT_103585 [Mortierella sp. GBAus27b]
MESAGGSSGWSSWSWSWTCWIRRGVLGWLCCWSLLPFRCSRSCRCRLRPSGRCCRAALAKAADSARASSRVRPEAKTRAWRGVGQCVGGEEEKGVKGSE